MLSSYLLKYKKVLVLGRTRRRAIFYLGTSLLLSFFCILHFVPFEMPTTSILSWRLDLAQSEFRQLKPISDEAAQLTSWGRALVYWLWDGTHNLKVEDSNPCTVYWKDMFFLLICCKNCSFCSKKSEYKWKRGRGWPIEKTIPVIMSVKGNLKLI